MADPTPPPAPAPADAARPPALPSTADTVPYVPVSWMAVAAAAAALLFVILLLAAGYGAARERRPLLQEWLLLLPLAAIVLSFAARRIVRNAEGTRTGELFGLDLVAASWWVALVTGLGYAAYLFAIDFAIRQEATAEVQRWTGYVIHGDIPRAFHRTLEPGRRVRISPDDEAQMVKEFRDPYTVFRQCDFVRIAERNPGAQFVPGGLRDWVYKSTGVECAFTGTLRTPEGLMPVEIPLRAVEAGAGSEGVAGRQWQFFVPSSGLIVKDRTTLTPYGWAVFDVERQGGAYGREFLRNCQDRVGRIYAYALFARGGDDPALRMATSEGFNARIAAVGPAAPVWVPARQDYNLTADRLFYFSPNPMHTGGAKPLTEGQKEQMRSAWATTGIGPPGGRLPAAADAADRVAFTDNDVQVRVPVEIPIAGTAGEPQAFRARVVVSCDDPELRKVLDELRKSADPDRGTREPPAGPRRQWTWRVDRIETDFQAITPPRMSGPPGSGPPPGGP